MDLSLSRLCVVLTNPHVSISFIVSVTNIPGIVTSEFLLRSSRRSINTLLKRGLAASCIATRSLHGLSASRPALTDEYLVSPPITGFRHFGDRIQIVSTSDRLSFVVTTTILFMYSRLLKRLMEYEIIG